MEDIEKIVDNIEDEEPKMEISPELIKTVEAEEKRDRKQIIKYRTFIFLLICAIICFSVVVAQIVLRIIKA